MLKRPPKGGGFDSQRLDNKKVGCPTANNTIKELKQTKSVMVLPPQIIITTQFQHKIKKVNLQEPGFYRSWTPVNFVF